MNVKQWEPRIVMKMQLVLTLMEVLNVSAFLALVEMEETAIMMVCLIYWYINTYCNHANIRTMLALCHRI